MNARPTEPAHFETPEREERQLLVGHLLANAKEIIYLRAPSGAGKTLFVRRLMAQLADDYNFVRLDAAQEQDLAAVSARQLDVDASGEDVVPAWPDNLLFAMAERELLVVVDNVDLLQAPTMRQLVALNEHGASILLVGRGGLVADDAWSPRVIDLPSFSEDQSAAFLRSRGGPMVARLDDEMAAALHSAAQGLPGPLLEGLAALEIRARATANDPQVQPVPEAPPVTATSVAPASPTVRSMLDRATASLGVTLPPRPWLVAGGVALGVLLLGTLVFQDTVNSWVDSDEAVAVKLPQPAGLPTQSPRPVAPVAEAAPDAGRVDPEGPAAVAAEPADVRSDPVDASEVPPTADQTAQTPAAPPEPAAATESVMVSAGAETFEDPGPDRAREQDPLAAVMRDALAAAATDQAASRPEEVAAPRAAAGSPAPAVPATSETMTSPSATEIASAERGEPTDAVGARPNDRAVAPAPIGADAVAAPAVAADPVVSAATATGWLRARTADRYTLQLVGSRERAAIDRFIARHGLNPPYAVFERTLRGAPWYSLVSGDYPDRETAVAARSELPPTLRGSDVWPRTFGSIQASMQ